MLFKIKETKANLLALNDEQLQTTTRLTILQNSQLTTELEFQSKQTEKLLLQNNQYKQKIETLIRDIDIHKEVEKELAKRSHFCQKVIKRLKTRVQELEAEKANQGANAGDHSANAFMSGRPAVMGLSGSQGRNRMQNQKQQFNTMNDPNQRNNEDLINFLEHKLEEIEKKLQKTQQEYELL